MTLYIVSTPIGNIKDITYRAVETLKDSDLILAEDTRRTGILLKHYDITAKKESFNDYNKEKKTPNIITMLTQGKKISLVSDAGTPCISDPGFYLVRECIKNNIQPIPVPGASAFLAALSCSGLPTDRFVFYGFLPKKDLQKKGLLEKIKTKKQTSIFYESPHRIIKTLKAISHICPDKKIVLARELTKKFEEFTKGTVKDVYEKLKEKKVKGEIVLLLN